MPTIDVRHENSFFTTQVTMSDDQRLFISLYPSDPQRLSVLGSGARVLFAVAESTTLDDARKLSYLINELCRQIVVVVDSSHPLFSLRSNT